MSNQPMLAATFCHPTKSCSFKSGDKIARKALLEFKRLVDNDKWNKPVDGDTTDSDGDATDSESSDDETSSNSDESKHSSESVSDNLASVLDDESTDALEVDRLVLEQKDPAAATNRLDLEAEDDNDNTLHDEAISDSKRTANSQMSLWLVSMTCQWIWIETALIFKRMRTTRT